MSWIPSAFVAGLVLRWVAQTWLTNLNLAEARRNRAVVPESFRATIDEAEYRKSVDYTVAKGRLARIDHAWDAVVTGVLLLSGVSPLAWNAWTARAGDAAWSGAAFLVLALLAISLTGLPLEWWGRFRVEARFGFNRSSPGLWVADKLKGALVAVVVGFPLVWLLLVLVERLGGWWWVAGWSVFLAFQLLMIVAYPLWILPLFNKLTPLPEGELRRRLLDLAGRASFPAATIQVIDGSRRSGHSNAYFTGFGRFRRIVLFDTLLEHSGPAELEAVLAHEIGHYKLGHVPRMLAVSALATLAGFGVIGWMTSSPTLPAAFGFPEAGAAPAFLLFLLLAGVVSFWVGPAMNVLSRKHEYEADAFARGLTGGPEALIGALRRLSQKNLSNLTPHPLFSAFHYSHPTLVERERALRVS